MLTFGSKNLFFLLKNIEMTNIKKIKTKKENKIPNNSPDKSITTSFIALLPKKMDDCS